MSKKIFSKEEIETAKEQSGKLKNLIEQLFKEEYYIMCQDLTVEIWNRMHNQPQSEGLPYIDKTGKRFK